MKDKYPLILALIFILSIFLTACDEEQDLDVSPSSARLQAESPITPELSQIPNSDSGDNGESEQYEIEFDFSEAVQNIYLFGHKISLPCTIEDFGEDFSLDENWLLNTDGDNYTSTRLFYKGKQIGVVNLLDYVEGEINSTQITTLILGDGYNNPPKNPWYTEEIELDFIGISFYSTEDEIIGILGLPTPTERADLKSSLVYDYSEHGSMRIRFWEDEVTQISVYLGEREY